MVGLILYHLYDAYSVDWRTYLQNFPIHAMRDHSKHYTEVISAIYVLFDSFPSTLMQHLRLLSLLAVRTFRPRLHWVRSLLVRTED